MPHRQTTPFALLSAGPGPAMTAALPEFVRPGSALIVWILFFVGAGISDTVTSVVDSAGNIYTKVFYAPREGGTIAAEAWIAFNVPGGMAPFATVSWSAVGAAFVALSEYLDVYEVIGSPVMASGVSGVIPKTAGFSGLKPGSMICALLDTQSGVVPSPPGPEFTMRAVRTDSGMGAMQDRILLGVDIPEVAFGFTVTNNWTMGAFALAQRNPSTGRSGLVQRVAALQAQQHRPRKERAKKQGPTQRAIAKVLAEKKFI